ncbi:MAG: histidinol-phosphatase HisJ family protein [Thermoleophilia bacterium]|nr:histidinol-phosphatase HisJ family protein [Thermoleophilia bacterium]
MRAPSGIAPLPDYHTHTQLCGHAQGAPREYVESARAKGLPAIGIADHLPLLHTRDPQLSMDRRQLEGYVEEVSRLKETHPGYVLLGIEADYVPQTLAQMRDLLAEYPFDYVLGSVHFIDGWGFDDPRNIGGFDSRSVDEIYRRYFELMGEAADSGAFTILGHVDLVKKFGHRPAEPMEGPLSLLAATIARAGLLVEINTAGLRRPVGEIYPAPSVLAALRKAGVRVTFGSDAHAPAEVGMDFAAARDLALDLGFVDYAALVPSRNGSRAQVETRPLPAGDAE